MLEECKQQLERLQHEKECAVEDLLERLAEEKFEQLQEIKMKYKKMLSMVKGGEEKQRALEEKRQQEIEEAQEEHNKKKKEGLSEIKDRYNELAVKVKVDASAVQEALKRQIKQE